MKSFLFIFMFILVVSCNRKLTESNDILPYDTIEKFEEFEYVFADSITHRGECNIYKFVIGKYNGVFIDTLYTESALYKRDRNNEWKLIQKEQGEASWSQSMDVDTLDLNDDGFIDFVYTSGIAARGSNRVNSCIVYDPKKESFKFLHNAPKYPTISYNKKLKCLDSQAIYGGSTTSFLRIEADSLFCFTTISLWGNERDFINYESDGSEKIVLHDTLGEPGLVYYRFSDYRLKEALEEYEEARQDLDSN